MMGGGWQLGVWLPMVAPYGCIAGSASMSWRCVGADEDGQVHLRCGGPRLKAAQVHKGVTMFEMWRAHSPVAMLYTHYVSRTTPDSGSDRTRPEASTRGSGIRLTLTRTSSCRRAPVPVSGRARP